LQPFHQGVEQTKITSTPRTAGSFQHDVQASAVVFPSPYFSRKIVKVGPLFAQVKTGLERRMAA
jgi:hypothetical protein